MSKDWKTRSNRTVANTLKRCGNSEAVADGTIRYDRTILTVRSKSDRTASLVDRTSNTKLECRFSIEYPTSSRAVEVGPVCEKWAGQIKVGNETA